MEEILAGLNEAQKKALTTTEGYIRVIAGAGSGKTRALAARFAYLVEAIGILPGNILCVTFTNKSANEMRQRIHRLTGDNDTGYICTFHSFCVSILQEDSYAVSYPKNFQVLDNADIDAMLKIIYEERGLTLRHMTFGNARDRIEIRKQMTIQTIGHDKLNQLRHVRFFGDIEGMKKHMSKQAAILRPKFEAVTDILEKELGGLGIGEWTKPLGGYFISFDALPGCAKAIVAKCKEAGVVMTGAGATFPYGKDPKDSNIRIAPSFPTPEEMAQAADLFALCVKLVSVDKLLEA